MTDEVRRGKKHGKSTKEILGRKKGKVIVTTSYNRMFTDGKFKDIKRFITGSKFVGFYSEGKALAACVYLEDTLDTLPSYDDSHLDPFK